MFTSQLSITLDALLDEMLMAKVKRVINSCNDEKQLISLRKYCELAKKRMRIKLISNHYIDIYYAEARDRCMSDKAKNSIGLCGNTTNNTLLNNRGLN